MYVCIYACMCVCVSDGEVRIKGSRGEEIVLEHPITIVDTC